MRCRVSDYCIFYISGLPGGISYVLQALTKNKLLEPTVEKRLNAAINTWIRTPFGTIGGYILFIQVMYNGHEFSYKENLACLTVGGLVAWNALFFGRRVPTAAPPSPDWPAPAVPLSP